MSIDPALAGGVVLTTVTDVIGILAFIGLASYLLLQLSLTSRRRVIQHADTTDHPGTTFSV